MQKHSAPENTTDIPTRDRLRGSLLAGAVGGSLLAMLPALQGRQAGMGSALLRLSLFT